MIKRQSVGFLFHQISVFGPYGAFMASPLLGYDSLFISKRLHGLIQPLSSYDRFPYIARVPVDGARGNVFRINGVIGLNLKGCSDGRGGLHKRVGSVPSQKARASALSPQQLVRDSEIDLHDSTDARLATGRGAYQRESPLGFPDHHLPEKIVVAVDVDEVLGNFVSALNRFIADRYSLNHSVSEYHVYEFFKIWNCSRNEGTTKCNQCTTSKVMINGMDENINLLVTADIRVHEFFKTTYFKAGIHPIPGARQALHKLSKFCNLSVVTSRQNAIKDHTIHWIEEHYPGLFQEIHFGNHFALDGESRPKSDICRSMGAKVLIDDNPRYAIECAEVGIRVLLFDYQNSYPWCKAESVNQHPLVTKVHDWEEVEQWIVSWIVF